MTPEEKRDRAFKRRLRNVPPKLRPVIRRFSPDQMYLYGICVVSIQQYIILDDRVYVTLHCEDELMVGGPGFIHNVPIEQLTLRH